LQSPSLPLPLSLPPSLSLSKKCGYRDGRVKGRSGDSTRCRLANARTRLTWLAHDVSLIRSHDGHCSRETDNSRTRLGGDNSTVKTRRTIIRAGSEGTERTDTPRYQTRPLSNSLVKRDKLHCRQRRGARIKARARARARGWIHGEKARNARTAAGRGQRQEYVVRCNGTFYTFVYPHPGCTSCVQSLLSACVNSRNCESANT